MNKEFIEILGILNTNFTTPESNNIHHYLNIMNNNNIKYRQCYWHSNGDLECKNINVPTKQDSKSYVEFNTFSNPNMK